MYPSGKKLDLQTQTRMRWLVLAIVAGACIFLFKGSGLGLPQLGLHFLRTFSGLAQKADGPKSKAAWISQEHVKNLRLSCQQPRRLQKVPGCRQLGLSFSQPKTGIFPYGAGRLLVLFAAYKTTALIIY